MFETIDIPFTEWSKKNLGVTKFATTRTHKYGEVGDYFVVNEWKYQFIYIIKIPLGFVRNILYEWEGAESPDEFEDEWIKIHPYRDFNPYQDVWYHHFVIKEKVK